MIRWLTRILTALLLAILGVFPYALARATGLEAGWSGLCALLWFGSAIWYAWPEFEVQAGEGHKMPFAPYVRYLSRTFLFTLLPVILGAIGFAAGQALFPSDNLGGGVGALIGVFVGFCLMWVNSHFRPPQGGIVRGRSSPAPLSSTKNPKLPENDEGLLWGGVYVPSGGANTHFMVVGATGSGKTLSIRLLMQDALRPIGSGAPHRALLYDAKQDLIGPLLGMGMTCPIFTFNPFDARCTAWEISQDVTDPASALQVAAALLPHDPGSREPFFVEAAQDILYGVLLAFVLHKRANSAMRWTLGDVLRVLQSPATIAVLLNSRPETASVFAMLAGHDRTYHNIMATIITKMLPYQPIAALWEDASRSGRALSLSRWLGSETILILGNSERARKPLDAINRALFQRVTELLLDRDEVDPKKPVVQQSRTWIFLDEVAEAGRLDGLSSLLAKGRSKGACVVLGFQDIETMREVYGEKIAHALTGQCNHKAILRLESPSTAQWASLLFGSYEAIEYRTTYSQPTIFDNRSPNSVSYAEQYVKRESVMESEFGLLPVTTPSSGLSGYYIAPEVGAYRHTYEGSWLFAKDGGLAPSASVAGIQRRSGDDQFLSDWTRDDLKNRLQIPELLQAWEDDQAFRAAQRRGNQGGQSGQSGGGPPGSGPSGGGPSGGGPSGGGPSGGGPSGNPPPSGPSGSAPQGNAPRGTAPSGSGGQSHPAPTSAPSGAPSGSPASPPPSSTRPPTPPPSAPTAPNAPSQLPNVSPPSNPPSPPDEDDSAPPPSPFGRRG